MFQNKFLPIVAFAGLLAVSGDLCAQSSSMSSTSEPTYPVLRIQLVIARYVGEKKISSIPYAFTVTTGGDGGSRIRMGVDAPIPVLMGASGSVTQEYKNFGTNIDCGNVSELPGGRYAFQLSVQNTAAVPDSAGDAKDSRPLFRRFEAAFKPVLRDGQSMPTVSFSDPVTGEVVKVDVTMNVVR
ncbi:MAG: hypothetical protein ABI645_02715 [Pseudomonadota bacterium]